MTAFEIWRKSYFHPRQAMDALAEYKTPQVGALYVLTRGLLLSFFFYLPLFLLKFEPISSAFLKILDTPDYYLYGSLVWPIFGSLSWVYLEGVTYVILRLLRYPANFDQVLNLGGLYSLTIGIVIILFDWLTIALGLHTNPSTIGIAHMLISDPWAMAVSAIFFKKHYGVPVWLTILLVILTRILYMPIAIVYLRT